MLRNTSIYFPGVVFGGQEQPLGKDKFTQNFHAQNYKSTSVCPSQKQRGYADHKLSLAENFAPCKNASKVRIQAGYMTT